MAGPLPFPYGPDLVLGQQSGADVGDAGRVGHAGGGGRVVAGEQGGGGAGEGGEPGGGPGGVVAEAVGEGEGAEVGAVAGDADGGFGARSARSALGGIGAADVHRAAVDHGRHAAAGGRREVVGGRDVQSPGAGGGHDRAGQRVLAGVLGRGGEGEEGVLVDPGAGRGVTAVTSGVPSVRVPVLSRAAVSISPRRSMATADLTRTPCRPALAMAESSGGMVARTTAHGEATIMKVMARSRASVRPAPKASGMPKTARVATTTLTE